MAVNFEDTKQFKKGKLGEKVVREYVTNKMKYVLYSPPSGCAHPFENLAASQDKKTLLIIEVKTKESRLFYPDTGINVCHYEIYRHISEKHNLRVLIIFVDKRIKKIYGNYLDVLDMPREITYKGKQLSYPMQMKNKNDGKMVIYFPMEVMEEMGDLSDDVIQELRSNTTVKPDYQEIADELETDHIVNELEQKLTQEQIERLEAMVDPRDSIEEEPIYTPILNRKFKH